MSTFKTNLAFQLLAILLFVIKLVHHQLKRIDAFNFMEIKFLRSIRRFLKLRHKFSLKFDFKLRSREEDSNQTKSS